MTPRTSTPTTELSNASLALKPSELTILLAKAIATGENVLIVGAPGEGKTDLVRQATSAAAADMILSHPAVEDPTKPGGLPWVGENAKSATFLPFGDLARAINAKKKTVWFLDDIGQATPAVQASYMQLLHGGQVGEHKISDHVSFIGATNRRTDRAGVSGLLEPVKSRFVTIVEYRADVDEWCEWALDNGVRPEAVAFLRFRPSLLSAFQPSADLTNSPTPRTWVHASRILDMGLPQRIKVAALAGAVGAGAAIELVSFLDMIEQLPNIDAIVLDPNGSPIPDKPSALYAVTTALATRANKTTFGAIARYAQRLVDEQHGEFAVLLVRDAQRRDAQVAHTADYNRLMCGPLGHLINGEVR